MKKLYDSLFYLITLICAVGTMIMLAGIIISIFNEGLPLFRHVKIWDFLFGTFWYPTHAEAEFGISTLIVGSLVVTLGALVIAIPLGLGSAIFISEIAPAWLREICKPLIELLAGIPSVVYGLFGMALLAPMIRQLFHLDSGLNAFTAAIILGLMVLPIISSMCEDALQSVPKALREASLALGATRWETITRVLIPASRTGVIGGVLMGFGRAIGETMVVLMVAGGSAQMPKSIFQSVRPMTAAISAEMGETVFRDIHYQSLFAIAIVLFIITFGFSLLSETMGRKR
ncbi:MAG: phosphate ABC transporter permease subunit PstC [Candidatus Cloacimonetes bacterium]|nr:phosphate ABC transporter permease subunit PstC [Candidatus Cloacimonadota bacterium]MDY0336587.1 phosphate ABC transporter permease subunit PstC [Candidatus Cloacimonadaceae bacterium]MCB5270124.1 phosphate ABC transporter permease subunit PstC [Candidatus Cloacimonadota bacterium]MCK9334262.1 phosphate ABC transporter permease subunit PstC [Candidatus Cloacimonadota bacterium]MDD2543168.1 phosphate ABC transporter permease subunit PstC [Candidatus Cloacimonadota bacterium]